MFSCLYPFGLMCMRHTHVQTSELEVSIVEDGGIVERLIPQNWLAFSR
jgi:hypothetical protein